MYYVDKDGNDKFSDGDAIIQSLATFEHEKARPSQ